MDDTSTGTDEPLVPDVPSAILKRLKVEGLGKSTQSERTILSLALSDGLPGSTTQRLEWKALAVWVETSTISSLRDITNPYHSSLTRLDHQKPARRLLTLYCKARKGTGANKGISQKIDYAASQARYAKALWEYYEMLDGLGVPTSHMPPLTTLVNRKTAGKVTVLHLLPGSEEMRIPLEEFQDAPAVRESESGQH